MYFSRKNDENRFKYCVSNGDNTITLTEPDGDVVVSVMEKV